MNIEYKQTPWPHFVGSLDEEMYYHAFRFWETDEKLKSYNISKNRSNIEIKDEILINYLTEVGLQVKNESEKLGIFEKYYPKLKKKIQCNDIKFTYSENPITDKGYPLRDWHLDLGNKIVTGLWYFKNVKEEDALLVLQRSQEVKVFKLHKASIKSGQSEKSYNLELVYVAG